MAPQKAVGAGTPLWTSLASPIGTVLGAMARSPLGAWLLWGAILVVVTIVLRATHPGAYRAHVALTYLLVVLGGSISGGRPLGLTLTFAGYLLIDYFFQRPVTVLSLEKPRDWVVLLAFLTTAVVTTQLLAQERARAAEADRRAREVGWLSRLGAEILTTGRAGDTLVGIVNVIRTSLDVARSQIYGWEGDALRLLVASPTPIFPEVQPSAADLAMLRRLADSATESDGAGEALVYTHGSDGRSLTAALRAHRRIVGVLYLADTGPIALDDARERFLTALASYAALTLERARLVAESAHDLRTPLTTIKALAQAGALRGDENALAIEEQADRLSRLVTDLLDFSRLNSGGLPVQPELNTAEDLVGAAVRQVSGLVGKRTLTTSVNFEEPALVGRFDFVQSLRILNNLLENAVRYSPPSSPVELSVHREDGTLVFSVADRGPGIPVAERERIFEPFYRRDSVSEDARGAGLGLAIARRLAELQGGSLEHGARPGGGSLFVLRLPAGDESL